MRMTTFAELGIPFPLFEAPAEQAAEYAGLGACSLCGRAGQHCFRLGIGSTVMADCPACGTSNGVSAYEREARPCRHCGSAVPFPELAAGELRACYDCLRAGKAALTKDSELGMISWEQAFEGVTHGAPGLNRADFEMVPGECGWVGARLPREMMLELLRTPGYVTWQNEMWQFCCSRPMVFLGDWSHDEFTRRAPDGDGRRFFEEVVQDTEPGLWDDEFHDATGVYVFRCSSCGRLTAHWDMA
jgi:uncharacterized protein CbrC (UPF0167 family)